MKNNHWFWNSRFVDFVAHLLTKLNSYMWKKQNARN